MKRKSHVCGEYPLRLYRAFNEEKYARQFVEEGKFRLGLLEVYRTIECRARRDGTEGTGHYGLKGQVASIRFSKDPAIDPVCVEKEGVQEWHTENGNSVFLLCCSDPSAGKEKIRSRFGLHVVEIVSPVSLAIDIDHALNGSDGRGHFNVYGTYVEYNKGQLIADGRKSEELTVLSYTQKPSSFSDEKEFRFCVVAMGVDFLESRNRKRFLDIDLGEPIRYASLL
jgi:hypothetical protein